MQQDAGRHAIAGVRGRGTVWMLLAILSLMACDALHPCFHVTLATRAGEAALTASACTPGLAALDVEECPVCAGLLHAVPMAPEGEVASAAHLEVRTAFAEGGMSRRVEVILPRGPPCGYSVI